MSESAKWYVVHTYSGYENAVKTSIEKFVTGRGMEDMILRIEVPMETVTEVTDSGATKEVERKVFPGYVLIPGIWCGTSAASPASWAPPTKPSPSRRRRFWPWAWKSMRSWSDTMWATM